MIRNFEFFSEKLYVLMQLDDAMKTLSRKASHVSARSRLGSKLARKALALKWKLKLRGLTPRKH